MGQVGESVCGKTTLGKTLLRLVKATSGHVYFNVPDDIKTEIDLLEKSGANFRKMQALRRQYDLVMYSGKQLKTIRRRAQLVYQDPFNSLNPSKTNTGYIKRGQRGTYRCPRRRGGEVVAMHTREDREIERIRQQRDDNE